MLFNPVEAPIEVNIEALELFGGRAYKRRLEGYLEEVFWVDLPFPSRALVSVESSQHVTGLLHNSVSSEISPITYCFLSPEWKRGPIG